MRPDPRTTLGLLVVGNIVLYSAGFTGRDLAARCCFMLIPAVIAALAGRWRVVTAYLLVAGLAFVVEPLVAGRGFGLGLVLAGVAGLVARVLPAAMYGYACLVTIRVSELMAALEHWRAPQAVVIPLAVVLRFLPTALDEDRAVAMAMRARGLSLRQTGVSAWLEYRLIPLITSTVKAGEELTQAALTRGLGAPGPVERIAHVGFRFYDLALTAVALTGLVLWMWP